MIFSLILGWISLFTQQSNANSSNLNASAPFVIPWLQKNLPAASPLKVLLLSEKEMEKLSLAQASSLIPSGADQATLVQRIRLVIQGMKRTAPFLKKLNLSMGSIEFLTDMLEKQSRRLYQGKAPSLSATKENDPNILLWDAQTQGQLEIAQSALTGIRMAAHQYELFPQKETKNLIRNIAESYQEALLLSPFYHLGKQKLKIAEQASALFPLHLMESILYQMHEAMILAKAEELQKAGIVTQEEAFWHEEFNLTLEKHYQELLSHFSQAEASFFTLSLEKQKQQMKNLLQELLDFQTEATLVANMDSCNAMALALKKAPTLTGAFRSLGGSGNNELAYGFFEASDMGAQWEGIYQKWINGSKEAAKKLLITKSKSTEWTQFHQKMSDILTEHQQGDAKLQLLTKKVVFVGTIVGAAVLTGGIGAYIEASMGITWGSTAGFLAATAFEGTAFTLFSNRLSNAFFHQNESLFKNFGENLTFLGGMRLLSNGYRLVVGAKAAASTAGQAKLLLTQFVAMDAYSLYQAEKEKLKSMGQNLSISEMLDISFNNMAFTVAMSVGAKLSQPWAQKLQVQGELHGTLQKIKQEHQALGKLQEQAKLGGPQVPQKEITTKQLLLLKLEQQALAALQKLELSAWKGLSPEEQAQTSITALQEDNRLVQTAQLTSRLEPIGPEDFLCDEGKFFNYVKDFFTQQGAKVTEQTPDSLNQARTLEIDQKDGTIFRVTERKDTKPGMVSKPPQLKTKPKSGKSYPLIKQIVERAIAHAVQNIPGLFEAQARVIFEEAFSRGSSVVFGGSRVRGDWKPNSDLDIGFGNLSTSQAKKALQEIAQVPGGLKPETTIIVPENKTDVIEEIKSPEEFFMRTGTRVGKDKRAGEPFFPSGYISYGTDGNIVICKPDGNIITVP